MILSIVKGSKRVDQPKQFSPRMECLRCQRIVLVLSYCNRLEMSHIGLQYANRKKKNKRVKFSSIESLKGVGPITRKKLLKKFKTISNLKKAKIGDIQCIQGISKKMAKNIFMNLQNL